MLFGDSRLPGNFWRFVEPEPTSGCWLWSGATARGYGYFGVGPRSDHRTRIVHRLVMEVELGAPLDGHVDHLCRVRVCVNPAHLEVVTQQENNRRQQAARTTCRHGHPLTEYRRHYGKLIRWCRVCHKEQQHARRQQGRE